MAKEHISMLGKPARDLVTGFSAGTCVCFDLYGSVMCWQFPRATDKGDVIDGHWFDVTRIEILNHEPVMGIPNFDKGYIAEGRKGVAEKPQHNRK